jgi:hypothetical protein
MNWLSGLPWPQITSTLGLALDIAGVLILFRTGLPSKAIRNTGVFQAYDENMARRYDRLAFCGVAAIALGFCLQIVGNWLQVAASP